MELLIISLVCVIAAFSVVVYLLLCRQQNLELPTAISPIGWTNCNHL